MTYIEFSRDTGFILPSIQRLTKWWTEYLEIWSWVPVFYEPCASPGHQDPPYRLFQKKHWHDLMWLTMPVVGALFLFFMDRLCVAVQMLGLSILAWRAFSLFVHSVHLPLFGWQTPGSGPERVSYIRAQRRILLFLVYFTELVIGYSAIYLIMSKHFQVVFANRVVCVAQAVQMSFATMTTVGYGTYAPVTVGAVAVAFAQALTGILMITGTIATLATILKPGPNMQDDARQETQCSGRGEAGYPATRCMVVLRMFLPANISLVKVLVLFVVFSSVGESPWDRSTWTVLIVVVSLLFVCTILGFCNWMRWRGQQ